MRRHSLRIQNVYISPYTYAQHSAGNTQTMLDHEQRNDRSGDDPAAMRQSHSIPVRPRKICAARQKNREAYEYEFCTIGDAVWGFEGT